MKRIEFDFNVSDRYEYFVTRDGHVYKVDTRNGKTEECYYHISHGYRRIRVTDIDTGKRRYLRVGRLVGKCFVEGYQEGLVIDHIEAGMGMKIFNYLKLDKTDYRVALIMNAESKVLGKKDILKIEKDDFKDIDYTVLGLLSPSITIDEIKDSVIVRKVKPKLPIVVKNILICKNPRCITSTEKYVSHSFKLMNKEKGTYRCEYCDEITRLSDM